MEICFRGVEIYFRGVEIYCRGVEIYYRAGEIYYRGVEVYFRCEEIFKEVYIYIMELCKYFMEVWKYIKARQIPNLTLKMYFDVQVKFLLRISFSNSLIIFQKCIRLKILLTILPYCFHFENFINGFEYLN